MIYVDDIKHYPGHGFYCHMMTDGTFTELHEFAEKIGLKRSMFQYSINHSHYDLRANKRKLAIKLGAIAVSSEEMVLKCSKIFK
jgi:hypothetical protein